MGGTFLKWRERGQDAPASTTGGGGDADAVPGGRVSDEPVGALDALDPLEAPELDEVEPAPLFVQLTVSSVITVNPVDVSDHEPTGFPSDVNRPSGSRTILSTKHTAFT